MDKHKKKVLLIFAVATFCSEAMAKPIYFPSDFGVNIFKDPTDVPSKINSTNTKSQLTVFNFRLYANNDALILQLSNGKRAIFKPTKTNLGQRLFTGSTYENRRLGEIETQGSERFWSLPNNTVVRFVGSFPTEISIANTSNLLLTYRNGKLIDLSTRDSSSNEVSPATNSTVTVAQDLLAEAQTIACEQFDESGTENNHELASNFQSEQSTQPCQDPTAELPVGFTDPTSGNIIRIEARSYDCHSYFTAFPDIQRGTEIEEALAAFPPYLGSHSGGHSFPVADYWNNGSVYVIHSRDLTAASYDPLITPNGLYDQVMQDGEAINENLIQPLQINGEITHTELGVTTTLSADQAQVIYLDVVVQYGVMTESQREQLNRAAEELLELYGIVVRIIEIP